MTDDEKKRMLSVVRATEFLFSETCALKTVLLSRRIPQRVWEPECARLMKDPELAGMLHAKFQHLYDEIEQAHDETKALEALLQALPKPKKDWN
jgi:hypothetical protein